MTTPNIVQSRKGSHELFERACKVMPDGNTRHTVHFEPFPVYAASGSGCELIDVDGNVYLDFVNNYSALIHGHSHPAITTAAARHVNSLISVGLPTAEEVLLAELLTGRIRGGSEVRFANSGTEAVMLAIKVARALTRRPKIAKVEGAYHGTYDAAEISQAPSPDAWGSPRQPASVATAEGTPASISSNSLVLPFNDVEAAQSILEHNAAELAAVLVDVAPSHVAYLQLSEPFLRMLRDFTRATSTLLILDEVYSFRYAWGGGQQRFAVTPDLTVLGKIIGGGFPIGAVLGSPDVMTVFRHKTGRPALPHGGTYNANPVTMAAGRAAMELWDAHQIARLERAGDRLRAGLRECIEISDFPAQVTGLASVAAMVMSLAPLESYRSLNLEPAQRRRLAAFHQGMLLRGILVDPRGTIVLSTPMEDEHVDRLLGSALEVMRTMAGSALSA